jgi:hypothetical protein
VYPSVRLCHEMWIVSGILTCRPPSRLACGPVFRKNQAVDEEHRVWFSFLFSPSVAYFSVPLMASYSSETVASRSVTPCLNHEVARRIQCTLSLASHSGDFDPRYRSGSGGGPQHDTGQQTLIFSTKRRNATFLIHGRQHYSGGHTSYY